MSKRGSRIIFVITMSLITNLLAGCSESKDDVILTSEKIVYREATLAQNESSSPNEIKVINETVSVPDMS